MSGSESRSKAWHIVGGISWLSATALLIGMVIARLTTTTRQSALVVVAGVAITGAAVGGFLAAPALSELRGKMPLEIKTNRVRRHRDHAADASRVP